MQYFWPASSDIWYWKPIFGLFESGCFTKVLLYLLKRVDMVYLCSDLQASMLLGLRFQRAVSSDVPILINLLPPWRSSPIHLLLDLFWEKQCFQRKIMSPCNLSWQACLLLFFVSQWSINYFKEEHAQTQFWPNFEITKCCGYREYKVKAIKI